LADPTRIFTWLICENYDDKGNALVYEYKAENSDGVDGSQVHEKNRTASSRSTNRYLKRIRYGNRISRLDQPDLSRADWMFEVVFDYGEGHYSENAPDFQQRVFVQAEVNSPQKQWPTRQDPFSSYRAGFEVRTYRLCRRVLMFHHFPQELGSADYLVRATEFTYAESPIASFVTSITQSGYVRQPNTSYLKKSLPPLEFEYSQAQIHQEVREIAAESRENLPCGLDGSNYQWVDLNGEGVSGIFTEQANGWFYKRNLSPTHRVRDNGSERIGAHFGPVELVAAKPATTLATGQAQFMDLAGDGQMDLVQLDAPVPGFYERTEDAGWVNFRPFVSWPNLDIRNPNLRFIDLDGDGHTDILISEDEVFSWCASLAELGFGPAARVPKPNDEEKGPRLVFADGTQSIYLADMCGDGLTDLVRIRNGEVCYWPNLGYGRFGAKVTMDRPPLFDRTDQFDQRRIRLGDIDGSGTTDIFYLGCNGITFWRNESGNRWSDPQRLSVLPPADTVTSISVVDLLGNGTACLVWSSPLPGHTRRPMRYIDLMDGQKPHLLISVRNNLGAETHIHYAPSTKFYLEDRRDGKPWITRLPFPVHVVERIETYDRISRNRFVTRYAYHHGYYDGSEREFRGFGMVEQWDTEEFAALSTSDAFPVGDNIDAASHVPPVHTKTWFHTGLYLGRDHVSDFFAGLLNGQDKGEYYREPKLADAQARALLLPDTVLPDSLTAEEVREACRALKGAMLRQEVYALDGSPQAEHPYTVTEQNFTVRRLQPHDGNRHAVFFTHARETLNYHYERNPADPRISHALTLEVDSFANVLKSVAIGYGRRSGQSQLQGDDKKKQEQTLIAYTENDVTNPIDDCVVYPDDYRTPLIAETRTYELTGFEPENNARRFSFDEWTRDDRSLLASAEEIRYEQSADNTTKQKRLIDQARTLYRPDDLGTATDDPLRLLPLGLLQPLALPGESYKLAFTPGLLAQVFQRDDQPLLPDTANVLGGQSGAQGGYLPSQQLKMQGKFPNTDPDDHWWIPSGRVFLSRNSDDTASEECDHARTHFFLPHRFRDVFHSDAVRTESFLTYDAYDVLVRETRDALGNCLSVGERLPTGDLDPTKPGNDYRVLQPRVITDPNGNRTEVAFDALGMVVATAVKGKDDSVGDTLSGIETDLTQAQLDGFFDVEDPQVPAPNALRGATTRIVYDLDRFRRTRQTHPQDPTEWLPVCAATLARETHVSDPLPPQGLKIQIRFSYSDGFGREIQKKIQAEPGSLVDGGPVVNRRWVGNGWVVFNNKGKPVRQYEPFFTDTHRFEFNVRIGVSPILFYDPVERAVATLHPNHTWEKVVFDPWRQESWDVNDTVLAADPRDDPNVGEYFRRLPDVNYLPTWHTQRAGGALGTREHDAARKAAIHAGTPTVAHFDSLGRVFLTVAHNKFKRSDTPPADPPTEEFYSTRIIFDIEGNQHEVLDAKDRVVMRYDYDILGNRIHQASMEAGERWVLSDATGKPLSAWDSRDHQFRTAYDPLRRPIESYLREGAGPELLVGRTVYGETWPNPEASNLRGKVVQLFDQAGVVTTVDYDFKGNLLHSQRQLAREYKTTLDWAGIVPLEVENYTNLTRYDALNRPTELTTPDNSVIRPVYNEANLLERVETNLRDSPTVTTFVTDIDYNAKGQRTRIDYGNGVRTTYEYDPLTFRLIHSLTQRNAVAFPDDCSEPPPAGWPGCQVQNLHYTYDPAGNITRIRDDAQQTIYFRNRRVEPSNDYTYDAIYRLIEATGREHLEQSGGAPMPHSYNDAPRVGIHWSANDGNALDTYTEYYIYDAVGNILQMSHCGNDLAHSAWTRTYDYLEASALEPTKQNNRLTKATIGAITETYSTDGNGYDTHGNMLRMPHLQIMQWDFKDQLQMTQRQAVNADDADGLQHQGERTWYVYDAGGQRVRKVTEHATTGGAPTRRKERVCLGGFEIYREYENDGDTVKLERETLHIMDDKQRIALVETRTHGTDPAPEQLIRYQFSNHLGSASLELDDEAQIISYEEYTPYGSTSYHAVRNQTDTPKRYRHTGKERDEESGLYYHKARYYACWLGRWTAADPAGLADGVNRYQSFRSSPVRHNDPDGEQPEDVQKAETVERNLDANEKHARRAARDVVRFEKKAAKMESKIGELAGDLERKQAELNRIRYGTKAHGELAAETIKLEEQIGEQQSALNKLKKDIQHLRRWTKQLGVQRREYVNEANKVAGRLETQAMDLEAAGRQHSAQAGQGPEMFRRTPTPAQAQARADAERDFQDATTRRQAAANLRRRAGGGSEPEPPTGGPSTRLHDVASGLNMAIIALQLVNMIRDIIESRETGIFMLGPDTGMVLDTKQAEGLEYRVPDAIVAEDPHDWMYHRKIIDGKVHVLARPGGPWVPEVL
jgi:RHS repeat-associated protein